MTDRSCVLFKIYLYITSTMKAYNKGGWVIARVIEEAAATSSVALLN